MRAIDADELIKKAHHEAEAMAKPYEDFGVLVEWLVGKMPPVQPEIIRCKDCNHRDPEDKKCDCGHDIMWQLPRDDNWYCADAERKSTE